MQKVPVSQYQGSKSPRAVAGFARDTGAMIVPTHFPYGT